MKAHTSEFKNQIKTMGRELDSKITYTLNGVNVELGGEQLNSITPTYQGALLKSVMKELDIDSNVYIPEKTILNYQFGVKVNGEYEYLNFGDYVVYSIERQEDTNSYKIICYDKMLYSMVDYEKLDITYPITIRDYINAICNKLGLTFSNNNDTFANYNRQINTELYLDSSGNSLGYTFRDVLDELSQVTASCICINDNDELEIRYISETNDIIDEEFLKDVNVNFGEKYGVINSIVLSRSAESDNVYMRDETSIAENGLCELKIIDNQIMNGNDRSDYLQDIFTRLNGTYYYLNDFSSTGIVYYDLCDRYNVQIGDNTYSCVMLNDEINITQGLEENIYAERPEETETDYTKTDKTDRKINQTYLIVDKQNQMIESVVSQTTEQNDKIATITQTVDELNSKISDVADVTTSAESIYASLTLNNINQSEPIEIKIHPIVENISYLYPSDNLYPSDDLYMTSRVLRFKNTKTDGIFDYELPDDLLYYDSENYDEFYLNYDNSVCYIIKRCGYNADGSVYILDEPITTNYDYPSIILTDGDYEISLLGYSNGYLYARLMVANLYTTHFATKVEMNSAITQATETIDLELSKKVGENEIIAKINMSTEKDESGSYIGIQADKLNFKGKEIDLTADNIVIKSTNFNVDKNGRIGASAGNIGGFDLEEYFFHTHIKDKYTYTMDDINRVYDIINGSVATDEEKVKYDINNDGIIDRIDFLRMQRKYYGYETTEGDFYLYSNDTEKIIRAVGNGTNTRETSIGFNNMETYNYIGTNATFQSITDNENKTTISSGDITCISLTQTSLEKNKKNFEKYTGALKELNNIDIYKYNLRNEEDDDKKHLGFIIGDNFNYSELITNNDNQGVDNYSFTSLCFQMIKEQQVEIEKLKKQIFELKEMINNGFNRI